MKTHLTESQFKDLKNKLFEMDTPYFSDYADDEGFKSPDDLERDEEEFNLNATDDEMYEKIIRDIAELNGFDAAELDVALKETGKSTEDIIEALYELRQDEFKDYDDVVEAMLSGLELLGGLEESLNEGILDAFRLTKNQVEKGKVKDRNKLKQLSSKQMIKFFLNDSSVSADHFQRVANYIKNKVYSMSQAGNDVKDNYDADDAENNEKTTIKQAISKIASSNNFTEKQVKDVILRTRVTKNLKEILPMLANRKFDSIADFSNQLISSKGYKKESNKKESNKKEVTKKKVTKKKAS